MQQKIITRVIEIDENSNYAQSNLRVTDFSLLTGVTASAYKHGSNKDIIARVFINTNTMADSPIVVDVENVKDKQHNRLPKPLCLNKRLMGNSEIKIQVRDMENAQTYPYKIIVTLYLR